VLARAVGARGAVAEAPAATPQQLAALPR
jgi:hypothetical protein